MGAGSRLDLAPGRRPQAESAPAHPAARFAAGSGPGIFYPAPLSGDPGKRRAARPDPGAEPPGLPHEVHLLQYPAPGRDPDPGLGSGASGLLAGGLAGEVGPDPLLFRG